MKLKCDSCIHRKVCKFIPKEDYPQYMKRIASENCKYFKEDKHESKNKLL